MAKKSFMGMGLSALSPNKIMKKINFLLKPKNLNKVLILLAVFLVLYIVYVKFLYKEGFEVSASDFESELSNVSKDEKVLVMFYADWCGHCKKLKPVWDEAAAELEKDENKGVGKMMKVNCGNPGEDKTHKAIMDKYGVQGYPTIKLFENGKDSEYTGGRSKEALLGVFGL